jgi:hypothetical protein
MCIHLPSQQKQYTPTQIRKRTAVNKKTLCNCLPGIQAFVSELKKSQTKEKEAEMELKKRGGSMAPPTIHLQLIAPPTITSQSIDNDNVAAVSVVVAAALKTTINRQLLTTR